MKKCNKHPEAIFNGRKCRQCNQEYQAKWYSKNRDKQIKRSSERNLKLRSQKRSFFKEYQSNCFCKCGESHPACLHFHHLNDKTKIANISKMVNNNAFSLKQLKEEISKCVVLCANCHAKITAEQLGWYKNW
jgi:hypothetical protein